MTRAFTLIEMLAVLAVIAIAAALVVGTSGRRDARRDAVIGAAEQLATTLRKVRALAMERKAVHAVAFNLENAPGSSGRVLNNRSGGHWYRVLGPALAGNGAHYNSVPILRDLNYWRPVWPNFTNFLREIESDWQGAPTVLPRGKVRFLALADSDEGDRRQDGIPAWMMSPGYPSRPYHATYPRPWFGVFEAASGRLHAWGGYDPDDADPGRRGAAGFAYQGAETRIDGCVNPATRSFDHWEDSDGSGAIDKVPPPADPALYTVDGRWDGEAWAAAGRPERTTWQVLRAGAPRALVNAAWLDCYIAFTPEGRAVFGPWMQARRSYRNAAPVPNAWGSDWPWSFATTAAGVQDMCKPMHQWYDLPGNNDSIATYERYTGGWFITLAPDAGDDNDRFPDAQTAMKSLAPAIRVFVSQHGDVRTIAVRMADDGALAGRTLWPADPAWWQDGNRLWNDYTFGQLHPAGLAWNQRVERTWSRKPSAAGKEVAPITDLLTPRMLSRQQWWYDE